ncbi:hypothetical protein SO574_12405 [Vibrio alfacsensis]|uniref:hypothetical protein n=1 Tax=Vibrio alfacsensis TaxID=1074311 RepID=UPI002ADDD75B|nr:hypothetical protein [Vibrio alfacsensis]WQE75969.1 hypothetical protein SO574_12405 [Vibrio alfacsensis]
MQKESKGSQTKGMFSIVKNITRKKWLITILEIEIGIEIGIAGTKKGSLSFPFSSVFFKKKKSARVRLIR